MWMDPDGLCPAMKAGDGAREGAKVFGIGEQFSESFPPGSEQEFHENLSVEFPNAVEFPWECEDRVVVVAVGQPVDLFVNPFAYLDKGANGAEPVLAGVVPESLDMPIRTSLDVPTEFRCAALAYRTYGLDDVKWKIVFRSIRFKVLLEDMLDDRFHAEP